VQRAIVRGVAKPTIKTYLIRDVELKERAWAAFEAQRRHMQLAGGAIFANPVTGKAWPDEKRQHQFWSRSLRRLGLRYREPYQTRHTFATLALMAGVNPSWVARQMGHVNPQMLFKVYARWIDGADKSRERDKLNAVWGHTRATERRWPS
jgi:integrase